MPMPTDIQRIGTGRKYGDLVFSPGDDTKPPLLTVPIDRKPEPRKETIPLPRVTDEAAKRQALALIDAGLSVPMIAEEVGVSVPTVRRWKQRAANPGLASEAKAEPREAVPPAEPTFRIALDPDSAQTAFAEAVGAWVQAHITTSFDGQTVHVDMPPLPDRWVVQATAVTMAPEEEN